MKFCVFSKQLQCYDFEDLAKAVNSIGVDGVDLTVREGGHVEPEKVKRDLPEAVKILGDYGLSVNMLTTQFTDIKDGHGKDIIEAAGKCGVGIFKLGYHHYTEFGSVHERLLQIKSKIAAIAEVCADNGVWGGLHNHSMHKFLGGNVLHAKEIINGLDHRYTGIYYDPGHGTVEGSAGSWMAGLDDIKDRIRVLALQDIVLQQDQSPNIAGVPLGDGLVEWERMCGCLKTIEDQIQLVSIHSAYHDNPLETIEAMKHDLNFFKSQWTQAAPDLVAS